MDFSPIISQVMPVFLWLVLLTLLIGFFKSPWFKGVFGETLVKLAASIRLPADTYHPIHNVTLPTPDGSTQIDHVFVSRYGIFVVETKNMKGWIFGSEHQAQWTQKIFKKSFKFQNPLRQNYRHVKALEALLDVPEGVVHSVIVFAGDCTFKTAMPVNVTYGGGYISYIKSFDELVLSESEVRAISARVESGRLEPSWETNRQHVRQLKARSNLEGGKRCPKCGGDMVLRTAKKGQNAGRKFWGCAAFPRCRMIINIA